MLVSVVGMKDILYCKLCDGLGSRVLRMNSPDKERKALGVKRESGFLFAFTPQENKHCLV